MKFKEFLIRYPLMPAFIFAGACTAPYSLVPIIPAFITAYISDKFIGPKENAGRVATALLAMAIVLCPWIGIYGQIIAACIMIIISALVSPRRIRLKKWMQTALYALTSLWFIALFIISCVR